jgi:two-component system response regulator LytT
VKAILNELYHSFASDNQLPKPNKMQTQTKPGGISSIKNLAIHRPTLPEKSQQFLDNLLLSPVEKPGKKSFLVFKQNKYFTISTADIAYFYFKYESSIIVCFDKQEYFVDYSLERIQNLVADEQFFRVNRQYLVNFSAIKETEHYFSRKLLVNLHVPANDKLLVPREKASAFLKWLENR